MANFSAALPAIDQNLCGTWAEQDVNLYNKLPYYLEKADAEMRARYSVWSKLLTDTVAWKPNMADTMRMVMVEKTPVLRQEARPNALSTDPMRDIFNVRERTVDASLYWHQFVSPHFRFLSAFQDFLKGNLVPTRKNIEEQIRIYEDMFYRTHIWDYSPTVYFAGIGPVSAPVGAGAKSAAWLQNNILNMPANGFLTFSELFKALSVFEDEIGGTPYEGSGQPGGDSQPLNERFCLVQGSQSWNNFVDDPWLKENRPLAMNIVTESFKGDFFGKIRSKLEKHPIRFKLDANMVPSMPTPESIDLDPASPHRGRTVPNSSYALIDQSPIEVAWMVGGKHYRRISTGTPPEFFAGGTSDPQKLAGMQWNGQVYANKNFLVPCKDGDGNTTFDTNSFGHFIRFQAELALGIIGPNAFNIMPIVFRRRRTLTTTIQP